MPPQPPSPSSLAPTPVLLLERALARLSEPQRSTLEPYLSSSDVTALREAHAAAQKCQRLAEHGAVRRRIGRVLTWIDRFKAVVDVVANADPIHIGLPWAGIRLILEIALAHRRQRQDLIRGLDIALEFSSRVTVYVEFLRPLPNSPERDLLERELVELYALILKFLANAIEVQEMRAHEKMLRALDHERNLEAFDADSTKLGQRVEFAAQRCESQLRKDNWQKVERWADELREEIGTLDQIRKVSEDVAQLGLKANLDRLPYVKGASFDSYEESQFEKHLDGTQVEILDRIMTWAGAPDAKSIFWLCGKAGTGKSTIARKIAEQCSDNGLLGASFFFKRSVADRSHTKLFFPTIMRHLSIAIPGLDCFVSQTLDRDPMISERKLLIQFEDLVLRPLQNMQRHSSYQTVIVVVDALDECTDGKEIRELLPVLAQLNSVASIRVLVTSRPELPVNLGFQSLNGDLHHDVILEHVQASSIGSDLSLYFRHRLDQLKADDMQIHLYQPLPQHWPGEAKIKQLVSLADPLFIAAFTMCEFVSQSIQPMEELDMLLAERGVSRLSGLAKIYLPILERLVHGKNTVQKASTITAFHQCIGPLILFCKPLSAKAMSALLEISLHHIDQILRHLTSVVDVPRDKDEPIRIFHLSFRDTLLDPQLRHDHPFWVHGIVTHRAIAVSCFRLLSKGNILKSDICGVKSPNKKWSDVHSDDINRAIAPELAYACQYWVEHLKAGRVKFGDKSGDPGQPGDTLPVLAFLQRHLLHWVEVMIWLDRFSDAIRQLVTLEHMTIEQKPGHDSLRALLQDARRFIVHFRTTIETAPLQLYHSALVFAPLDSVTKKLFRHMLIPGKIVLNPQLSQSWSPEKTRLIGHRMSIAAMAFSQDGRNIATSSDDLTIRLWDAHTGDELRRLHPRQTVANSIVFTILGEVLATAKGPDCADLSSIVVWDASKNLDLETWRGRMKSQVGACFSYKNGRILATPPIDDFVNIWNTETFQTVIRFQVGPSSVAELAIDPNGEMLAVRGDDNLIELYDLNTGSKMPGTDKLLRRKTDNAKFLTFSHRERLLAFTGNHARRLVWDAGSSDTQPHICFSRDSIRDTAVAFSPVHQMLAVANRSGLIDLYLVRFDVLSGTIEIPYERIRTLSFSPDGRTLASGSVQGIVKLWDIPKNIGISPEQRASRPRIDTLMLSPDGRILVCQYREHVEFWKIDSRDRSLITRKTLELWASSHQGSEIRDESVTIAFVDRAVASSDRMSALLACSPERNTVATVLRNGSIKIFNSENGSVVRQFEAPQSSTTALALTGDGCVLAAATLDTQIRLWNTSTGVQLAQWQGTGNVSSIALSSDGRTMITALLDQTVAVWVVGMPTAALKFDAPYSSPGSRPIALSTSGRLIATVVERNIVSVFNVQTGQQLTSYRHWSSGISRLDFAQDDRVLETDLGSLSLEQDGVSFNGVLKPPELRIQGEYVQFRGQDELWLPPEQRGWPTAWRPGILAVALKTGRVSLYSSELSFGR